tara:strand:- start:871 stop:1983 length:1113 start_codon:yes stop_codon:yes gene_type:complete
LYLKPKINSYSSQHGGNLIEEARRLGVNAKSIIDASASVVPFSPPIALRNHLKKAVDNYNLRHYPDIKHKKLKEAISNWHQIETEMILPGNGASELFTWAAKDASILGLNALPAPCFSDYERALNCWDANYIYQPLPLAWSDKRPQDFPLTPKAKVLWITNPHNPTGQLWSKHSIESLLNEYELVICDEAFLPLVPNGEQQSVINLVEKNQNLIVIRSLTKLFSIPGLRLGYAIGSPDRLRKWSEIRGPWPLNGIAISAGEKIMTDTESLQKWIYKIQHWITKEGEWLYIKLKETPSIKPLPSSVNFLLIEGTFPLGELRMKIAERLILLRDCRSFRGLNENYLRISLQTRKGNKKLIYSLNEIMKLIPQ